MSRYTTRLMDIWEQGYFTREDVEGWFKDYELTDYLTQEQIDVINERGTWSKDKLATKIVDHYLTREIGYETPALFAHYVKEDMKEIMEEYLPLIYSAAIKFDPLVNVDFTETYHSTDAGLTSGTSNASGLVVNSDTPMKQISKEQILQGKYASNTSASDTDNTSTANSQNESNYTKTMKGNSGVSATAQRLILQYRDTVRAFDRDIIERLNDEFMTIY